MSNATYTHCEICPVPSHKPCFHCELLSERTSVGRKMLGLNGASVKTKRKPQSAKILLKDLLADHERSKKKKRSSEPIKPDKYGRTHRK